VDFGRALVMGRKELAATSLLGVGQLRDRQRRMLRDLVRHATTASPLYRDLYRGVDHRTGGLAALPPVTKAQLMERFDDWVTDPRLNLGDVERHIEGQAGDVLHLGRYRVVATAGSSGRRGVFVYSRREWVTHLANFGRLNEQFVGVHPRLPPRLRVAAVGATSPLHISVRTGLSLAVGVNRVLRLDARQPLAELATALEAFRPEVLVGYPSALALLADEQLHGRLDVHPTRVVTVSEVRTAEMEEAIRTAWGVQPFDWYGITEGGVLAGDCAHHRGMHLFEDLFIVENVDEHGREVPDGEIGHKLLLTNLFNRTQPIIRYELSDMVAIDSQPCPCGRSLRRVVSLDGRTDDMMYLPGTKGGRVAVHPITVRSPFARLTEVRQYRVVHDLDGLHVLVVLREGVDRDGAVREIGEVLGTTLAGAGVIPPPLHIEVVDALERDPGHGAKYKLVGSRLPVPTGPAPSN